MPLKFVLTRLDALAGSRVGVTGLLIGAGGVDGINATEVKRVAERCPKGHTIEEQQKRRALLRGAPFPHQRSVN